MFATLYASLAAHFKGIQIFDDISQNGNHYNSGLASWLELGQKTPKPAAIAIYNQWPYRQL